MSHHINCHERLEQVATGIHRIVLQFARSQYSRQIDKKALIHSSLQHYFPVGNRSFRLLTIDKRSVEGGHRHKAFGRFYWLGLLNLYSCIILIPFVRDNKGYARMSSL